VRLGRLYVSPVIVAIVELADLTTMARADDNAVLSPSVCRRLTIAPDQM
jgi:hypothetical protein